MSHSLFEVLFGCGDSGSCFRDSVRCVFKGIELSLSGTG